MISFSPFPFCLIIDYSKQNGESPNIKASFRDDTNNKKDEDDEYLA